MDMIPLRVQGPEKEIFTKTYVMVGLCFKHSDMMCIFFNGPFPASFSFMFVFVIQWTLNVADK